MVEIHFFPAVLVCFCMCSKFLAIIFNSQKNAALPCRRRVTMLAVSPNHHEALSIFELVLAIQDPPMDGFLASLGMLVHIKLLRSENAQELKGTIK